MSHPRCCHHSVEILHVLHEETLTIDKSNGRLLWGTGACDAVSTVAVDTTPIILIQHDAAARGIARTLSRCHPLTVDHSPNTVLAVVSVAGPHTMMIMPNVASATLERTG
jgi:hypothetical protein